MGAKLSFKSSIKMGCAISGVTPKSGGDGNADVGLPHLSDNQIQMIKESWKVIRDDIAKVGIIMFVSKAHQKTRRLPGNLISDLISDRHRTRDGVVSDKYLQVCSLIQFQSPISLTQARLFETHPECKDVFFLFRDVEDLERLRNSRELRAHGLRVMSFIEKSVARLDQLERLEALAIELGKSHYRYNAPPKYYSYVGAEFICAVQPILKEQWTPDLEEAWKTMFLYVTGLMKQGYQEEERMRLQQDSTSPKERPDKRNTVL